MVRSAVHKSGIHIVIYNHILRMVVPKRKRGVLVFSTILDSIRVSAKKAIYKMVIIVAPFCVGIFAHHQPGAGGIIFER